MSGILYSHLSILNNFSLGATLHGILNREESPSLLYERCNAIKLNNSGVNDMNHSQFYILSIKYKLLSISFRYFN